MSDASTGWRGRILRLVRRVLKIAIVTLAMMQVFNIVMYVRANSETRKIAHTEYGEAFESIDHRGKGDIGVLLFHGLHGTPRNFKVITDELAKRKTDKDVQENVQRIDQND